ncbi:MAG: iron-regulated protein [Polyangiaceae bacterium]|nr:iron-regulated protein [Polyangiaceae bacterium]MBK8941814.1 iron-regulated protein [Polyangiaceae bacterium]
MFNKSRNAIHSRTRSRRALSAHLAFSPLLSLVDRHVHAPPSRSLVRPLLLAMALALPLAGCGDDTSVSGGGGEGGGLAVVTDADLQPVIEAYAANALASYEDALAAVGALDDAVAGFVAAPSASSLAAARQAWVDARPIYMQTEALRFYGGPIDDDAIGPEGRVNGWPLDELYIDYVAGPGGTVLESGIIYDTEGFPEITQEAIAEANEAGGEKNVSCGFHAIEFLLWGQDQSETGPGARPHTDFITGPDATAANGDRRSAYLLAVTELLTDDLTLVVEAWQPAAGTYASTFVADPPRDSLLKILTGMGMLAGIELAAERMNNAYEERDQEEEHSCFSDTTHLDNLNDLVGIEDVYLGRLGGTDGPGVDELVALVDPALDEQLKAELAAAREALLAIPEPFDQAILDDSEGGGREKIAAAIDAVQAVATSTVAAAEALGLELNLQ